MIVDKDTGKVYDMRNPDHIDRLTAPAIECLNMNNTMPDMSID